MRAKKLVKETLSTWSKSKTMTFNGLMIALIITAAEGWLGFDIDPETAKMLYTSLLVPVANMVLRHFTNFPLKQKETLLE